MKAETPKDKPTPPKVDVTREIVETVAVVLALVTLLRGFVAEAFVIPTGSMAPTLLGANRKIICPQCGYQFIVNASEQAEGRQPVITKGGICQNCRFPTVAHEPFQIGPIADPSTRGGLFNRVLNVLADLKGQHGDRVIVAKYQYEVKKLNRWEIAVFKYPAREYIERGTYPSRTNFIKRIVGLPGDELFIYYGDLFARPSGEAEFAIAAKPPDVMLATRRLVFDNDLQPSDLMNSDFPPRWATSSGDSIKNSKDRKTFSITGSGTLAYRHLIGGGERNKYPVAIDKEKATQPQVIIDFEPYNRPYGAGIGHPGDSFGDLFFVDPPQPGMADSAPANWVGDLMLEGNLHVKSLNGSVTLQLHEGTRTYRCQLALNDSGCEARLFAGDQQLASQSISITAGTNTHIRFANFDDRLVLWINNGLVFGNGVKVDRLKPEEGGPTKNDLEPAKWVFDKTEASLSGIRLYRDIYYVLTTAHADEAFVPYAIAPDELNQLEDWRSSLEGTFRNVWKRAEGQTVNGLGRIYRVPEGHYMACGDNSPRSFDSRGWELQSFVPHNCLLGKGVVVYWPLEWPPWLPRFLD